MRVCVCVCVCVFVLGRWRSSWGFVLIYIFIYILGHPTGFDHVTDAGLKVFSAAVGSSWTITTVALDGKCECLVCLHEWTHVLVCMRVCSVGAWMRRCVVRCVCVTSA